MTTTHTPGPWDALPNLKQHGRIVARGHWVADTLAQDAHLIAAAPELLAALEKAEYVMSAVSHHGVPQALEQARAAIAKAKGAA